MKHPARYSLFAAIGALLFGASAFARPIGFSEISLLVRAHESESSIKDEVAQRKLLHTLTQPQEHILKQQGASDSLIQALRNSSLVAPKEEVSAMETANSRPAAAANEHAGAEHRHRVQVFDVAIGHPVNLSQWGGLDYEIAFYSYRFAGEDHIQPAIIDPVASRTVASRTIPLQSENEVFNEDWYPTNGTRNWRYTPYNAAGGSLYNGRGDFRDVRSINFSDSVAVSSYSASRPIMIDWNNPVFFQGEPYSFYPVYAAGGVSLYFVSASSDSVRLAVSSRY